METVCLGMQAFSVENFKVMIESTENWSAFCYHHKLQFEPMSSDSILLPAGVSHCLPAGYTPSCIYLGLTFPTCKYDAIKDLIAHTGACPLGIFAFGVFLFSIKPLWCKKPKSHGDVMWKAT